MDAERGRSGTPQESLACRLSPGYLPQRIFITQKDAGIELHNVMPMRFYSSSAKAMNSPIRGQMASILDGYFIKRGLSREFEKGTAFPFHDW
jgi:hypothetical protein